MDHPPPQEPTSQIPAAPSQWSPLIDSASRFLAEESARRRADAGWRKLLRDCAFWGFLLAVLVMGLRELGITIPDWVRGGARPHVAVINITGSIAPGAKASADRLVPLIEQACASASAKALVLRIDSAGGSPVEADRIGAALERCRTGEHAKPIHAQVGSIGASAAYMIAVKADTIRASRYALVGSIGVVRWSYDASEAARRVGIAEEKVASGALKGGSSYLRKDTPEERALWQELIDGLATEFLDSVVTSRGDRLKATREEIGTGRVWTAAQAHRLGLIDQVALFEDVREELFGDLPVRTYAPRNTWADVMGLESAFRGALASALEPRLE